jgi:ketosteroid isomerase-like protein
MYHWIVRRSIPAIFRQLTTGRLWLVRIVFHPSAEFVFPGRHSYAANYADRDAIAAWLARFAALKPDYVVDDVIVNGPPWRTRIAVRFHDAIGDDYRNEGMHYIRMRWGRVTHERVFIDTQTIEAWESRHPALRASVTS